MSTLLISSLNIAGAAILDVQVVANLPARGDKILTVVSDKPDKIVSRNFAAAFLIISKGLCMKMSESDISKDRLIRLKYLESGFLPMTSEFRTSQPFSATVI
jgi:hypothetical protein